MIAAVIIPSGAVAARQTDAFQVAINNGDFDGAAKEIEKLKVGPLPKGVKRPSLDAYYGRYFAAGARGYVAEPYLIRAIATTNDSAERDQLAFELARAREVVGLVGKAAADYRRLSQDAGTDPAIKRDATISLARLRLGAAPDESITLLAPLAVGSLSGGARWEPHLLLSRAYAIKGQMTESSAALAAAWQEAPSTPSPGIAITVTAMDMAIDRALARDRPGEVGLISGIRLEPHFAGVGQLPVCGVDVHPEDSVTVAIAPDEEQRPLYSAVRASRPGIAQFFTGPLASTPSQLAGAPKYVTLRCRSEPAANLRIADGEFRNLTVWMAERGLYPSLHTVDPSAGDPITQVKASLQQLEVTAGPEAPILAPLLLQLAYFQGAQSRFNNAVSFAEAKALADRALKILTKAGAPSEVLAQISFQTTVAFAQNQNIADVAGPATLQTMSVMTDRPDTTPEQAFTAFAELTRWQLRPTDRLALANRLLVFFDARKVADAAPIRQAVELGRASALREIGNVAGLRERLVLHGFGPDLCVSADREPSFPPAAITLTADDYPKDLLHRNVNGVSIVELSVAEDGTILNKRLIVSQPAGLFDSITEEKLGKVTLLPAQLEGKAVKCRGMIQTVRWEIPSQDNFDNPFESMPTPTNDGS